MSKKIVINFILQILVITWLINLSIPVLGQFEQPTRVEFQLEEGFEGKEIFSIGENGFVLSATTANKTIRHFNEWKFLLFDTTLSHIFSKTSFISEHLVPYSTSATNTFSHSCFLSSNGDYLLNTFTVENFDLTAIKGTFPMKGEVKNMVSSERYAWFSYETKMGWYLISVDWMTGDQKVYPIVINDVKSRKMEIIKIQVIKESQKLLLYVRVNKNKMVSSMYVMKYSAEADLEYVTILDSHDDENIIEISGMEINKDEFVFTGTYSRKRVDVLSEGLFFIKVREQKVTIKRYYNFDNLNDFGEVHPQDYKYGYPSVAHDLIPTDSGFVFMAEMYYPRYALDVNNVPVHIGNTYTHATICGFDTLGEMKWNNTLELKLNGITVENEGVIRVLPTRNNKIKFAYAEGNYYMLNVLDVATHTLSDPQSVMIDNSQSTQGNSWFDANILAWYGQHWLFFSTQTKKVKLNGKSIRVEVLFLSKEP